MLMEQYIKSLLLERDTDATHVRTIVDDLIIPNGMDVTLPNLTVVGGTIHILMGAALSAPALTHCGKVVIGRNGQLSAPLLDSPHQGVINHSGGKAILKEDTTLPKDAPGPVFYRTIVQTEVLSEYPISYDVPLEAIARMIHEGDCSGQTSFLSSNRITPEAAAKALLAQGSAPEFFGLDAEGRSLSEKSSGETVNYSH